MSEPDEVILSVALKSGGFKTELRVPLPCTDEERDRFIQQWLELIVTGFRVGALSLDATLKKDADS